VFGISGFELLLVAVFALMIFGPDKIPEIARTVSKAVKTFKRAQADMERLINLEMYSNDPDKATSPFARKDSFAGEAVPPIPVADKPATVASSLYAATDEDEEEEDEE